MKKLILGVLMQFFAVCAFAAVNINTADVEQLKSLAGIGDTKARAIIEYREQNGAFRTKEDLKSVKGIGDKIFQKIEEEITVGVDKASAVQQNKTVKPATKVVKSSEKQTDKK